MHLLLDENFNNDILRGLLRRKPDLDVVRVQDIEEISGADDAHVLEWAANEVRIVFTHDVQTMTGFAYERVRAGKPMPGLFEVRRNVPLAQVIEDMLILVECSYEGE